ncbi:hypothetical protein BBSC_2475 [Bifidobacterium scardovii JCM 12489 = DSM 13734]|nr:hypothetical protein BBSC_2475 [Bifidobacterium scardovii JCM 12489 = DSM 13734]
MLCTRTIHPGPSSAQQQSLNTLAYHFFLHTLSYCVILLLQLKNKYSA